MSASRKQRRRLRVGSLSALSANAGYGAGHGARVTRRPATGFDLGYEVADDAVEQAWRFEIDGVSAIRHHRESRRWDGALHQQRRRQAGPVLVAGEDQRRHHEAGHLVLQMIQRRTLLLAAELGVDGTQSGMLGQLLLEHRNTARVFRFELHAGSAVGITRSKSGHSICPPRLPYSLRSCLKLLP